MRYISLVTILFFTSCSFFKVGPDYKAPETKFGEHFAQGKGARSIQKVKLDKFQAVQYNWWREFHDDILDQIIKIALVNNYDYKIAQSRVIEARANVAAQHSKSAPKVDLKTSGSRRSDYFNFFSPGIKNKPVSFFSAGFDASWELDLFGKNYRSKEAARSLYEASMDAKNYVIVSLISDVVKNYSQVRAAQSDYLTQSRINKCYKEILALSKQKKNAGILGEIDLTKMRTDAINSNIKLLDAKTKIKTSLYSLAILLGKRPSEIQQIISHKGLVPILINPVIVDAPISLIRNRPDIRQAERELEFATAQKGVAIAEAFPDVSLGGFFGLNTTKFSSWPKSSSRVFAGGLNASVPLINFGGILAGYKIAEERRTQALLKYKSQVNQALNEVESSLVKFINEDKKFDLNIEKIRIEKNTLKLKKERYRRGISSYPQYLNSHIAFLEKQRELNKNRLDFTIHTIALYKSLGGGWQDVVMKNLPLPEKKVSLGGLIKKELFRLKKRE